MRGRQRMARCGRDRRPCGAMRYSGTPRYRPPRRRPTAADGVLSTESNRSRHRGARPRATLLDREPANRPGSSETTPAARATWRPKDGRGGARDPHRPSRCACACAVGSSRGSPQGGDPGRSLDSRTPRRCTSRDGVAVEHPT
ncbi:hypothetical protein CRE_29410 [Caenorhabditis remanei]|uniref:Uncharacterized protein n=1 Tax=Caenorhabditis remanei TaxID=31234 RepID=E3NWJ6_CAERE|nr:hypothetical protein CRE_29410 [Caenorhabditis remanei]